MKTRTIRRLLPPLASVILFSACALAAWASMRAGAARLLAKYAVVAASAEPAQLAVELSPSDAETHTARGSVLFGMKETGGALAEFERAAALRPRDYFVWLQLGRARDEAGDADGAARALQEAIRLAPFYSEPRWQYGNFLYRRGRLDEGFDEMRRAAESNPSLYPAFADLAWGTNKGDARAVVAVVRPHTDAQRLALARLFARSGKTDDALALLRASVELDADERKSLLLEFLKAKQFRAAYEVWARGRGVAPGGVGVFDNPGFEGPVDLSERGFGWRQEHAVNGVTLSRDIKTANSGARSLLLEWAGEPNPGATVISQLVLVEPGARYRLSFAARTEGVKAGALPLVFVADESADDERVLAESRTLPPGASPWQLYEVEFTAGAKTEAVLVGIRRQNCESSPCPMFGRVWLDDFSLRKLDARPLHQ
jgi:Tetratricopeptide repeat